MSEELRIFLANAVETVHRSWVVEGASLSNDFGVEWIGRLALVILLHLIVVLFVNRINEIIVVIILAIFLVEIELTLSE